MIIRERNKPEEKERELSVEDKQRQILERV